MLRVFLVSALYAIATLGAVAQPATKPTSNLEYKTAKSALEDLRAKKGVNISVQAGWTIVEDRSTMSLWSFTPQNHPAHPAAIQRAVVQQGDNIVIQMKVLCEATKSACDAMVTEFQNLNNKVREDVRR